MIEFLLSRQSNLSQIRKNHAEHDFLGWLFPGSVRFHSDVLPLLLHHSTVTSFEGFLHFCPHVSTTFCYVFSFTSPQLISDSKTTMKEPSLSCPWSLVSGLTWDPRTLSPETWFTTIQSEWLSDTKNCNATEIWIPQPSLDPKRKK